MITLVANVESLGDRYVAYIESIKGMVVESDTLEGVCEELMISLKVKIAYNLGIDITKLKANVFKSKHEFEAFKKLKLVDGRAKRELNLQFC